METIPTPIHKCSYCNKKMRAILKDYLFIKNNINKRAMHKKCYKEYLFSSNKYIYDNWN